MTDPVKPFMVSGLNGEFACSDSLAGCSKEIFNAALPWIGLLAGAVVINELLKARTESRNWHQDIREQQQEVSNRFQMTSAMILIGGVVATALAIFKVASTAAATAASGTIIGGIWLGVTAAVMLNYLVHKRAFADDGRQA